MSFTPGPWEVAPYSSGDELLNVVAGYKEVVKDGRTIKHAHWIAECDAGMDFDSDREAMLAENEANAHLIAAAPDLYTALKAFLDTWLLAETAINGAIAIAALHGCPYNGPYLDIDALRAALAKAEGR